MQKPQEPASRDEDPALRIAMAEYQAGSVDAFDRLHDALASDLKAYLSALARDPTRADDLLQETFLQIHRSRAAHTPGEAVRPWVFAIAKRVFLMYRRGTMRRQRHEQMSASESRATAITPSEAERVHAGQQIDFVLQRVAPDGRRAFVWHHLLGFSFKEIAAKLGIKPGAAKIRSSRAASAMRALLREHDDE